MTGEGLLVWWPVEVGRQAWWRGEVSRGTPAFGGRICGGRASGPCRRVCMPAMNEPSLTDPAHNLPLTCKERSHVLPSNWARTDVMEAFIQNAAVRQAVDQPVPLGVLMVQAHMAAWQRPLDSLP